MSDTQHISKEIFNKQKEFIRLRNEIETLKFNYDFCIIQQESVKKELLDLVNQSVEAKRDFLLSRHPHYKLNHKLRVEIESYYDDYWFRKTYGSRHVYDDFGRHIEYEGPDVMIYTGCDECKKYFTREGYRNEINKNEDKGKEIFDDNLMRLEKEVTYSLLTS